MSHEITKLNLEIKTLKKQIENILGLVRAQSMAIAALNRHAEPPKVVDPVEGAKP